MDAKPTEPQPGKPARRLRIRRDDAHPVERVKRTIVLDADTDVRLSVHAKMARVDVSAFVSELINVSCKRYVIQDRGKATSMVRSADQANELESPVENETVNETVTSLDEPESTPAPAGQGIPSRPRRGRAQTAA